MTDPRNTFATLVQDDTTFNAIIVGLGAFGVVYSVTIETVPFYWIKETREIIDWSAVKERLGPNGDILKYHTNEILMNAYASPALVTKWELVTERPPPDAASPPTNPFVTLVHALPALEKIWQLISKPGDLLDDLYRELGNVLAVLLKPLPPLVPTNHRDSVVGKYNQIFDIGLASSAHLSHEYLHHWCGRGIVRCPEGLSKRHW